MKDNLRLWVIVTVALMGALVVGGWFLGAQPLLASAASADTTADQLAVQNQTVRVKLAALEKESENTAALQASAKAAGLAVPTSLSADDFVRRVNVLAKQDGVKIVSVTPGAAIAYSQPPSVVAAAAAAAAVTAAAQPGATPAPSPSATAAAVVAAPVTPVLAASDPTITSANFTVIPMVVDVTGSSAKALQFTTDMQNDTRLFLVTGYASAAAGTSKTSVTATLTGYIYALKG